MKKRLLIISIFILVFLLKISVSLMNAATSADCPSGYNNGCTSCTTKQTCIILDTEDRCYCTDAVGNTTGNPIDGIGNINNPLKAGALGPSGGLVSFLNNVLRLIFVVAGIYSLVQIVLAGFGFISAGADPKAIEKSWNTIWQSILGLIIIVGSLALAALLGLLLFGDAGAILNPKIYGPG